MSASLLPQIVSARCWYYENKENIHVLIEGDEGPIREVKIPWHMLARSMNRARVKRANHRNAP